MPPFSALSRHFCYDLQAGKISSHSAKEASALFFEHQISSGIDINDHYILFELSDGADDAHGVKLYQSFKYENDPQRELILRTGIVAGEGHHVYSLIGSSNSGIQSHSYVFRRGSLEENERLMLGLMPRLRELEMKKGCAKRIKYQGLLFSGAQVVDLPQHVVVREIPSVERLRPYSDRDTYDFTDGCGLISFKLASYLHEKIHGLGLSKKGQKNNVPSVFHIRYAGRIQKLHNNGSNNNRGTEGYICKGVFLVDYRNNQTHEMCLRKSMLKEVVSEQCADILGAKIGIIGWSKESPGRLSQQLICLLTASVPDQILLDIQQQQQDAVENATRDPLSAAWLAGLEPKAAPWYAFQGMLHGAAREYQSMSHASSAGPKKEIVSETMLTTVSESKEQIPPGTTSVEVQSESMLTEPKEDFMLDAISAKVPCESPLEVASESKGEGAPGTPATKVPSSYFACINGRNHPRHLPENPTKVQVPLASCRTLFGAAFPETLSSCTGIDGFCINEGECIVMLEDGPLEDEIVIVSRSPSYHPGDVRVLHNKASELPATHPVHSLSNCILFTTLGERPDADKMGGGDLDGDKFLVVWDSRLIKFRDKIQSHKAQDYDVETSDNKSSRSMVLSGTREKRETDWIHSAAMLDSVMLGAIENSYYALAKEFGVVSEEINQLNQLFSQLIDRKPSAIETFETLCKKAYNPQHAKKSLSDTTDNIIFNNRDSLWEKMLQKQKQLFAKVKEQMPDLRSDYEIFNTNLFNLCNPHYFDRSLAELHFHFGACLHRKKAMQAFQKFRDMLTANESPSIKLPKPLKHQDACISHTQFMDKLKTIMLNANLELSKPLESLRMKQQARREVIRHQRALYSEIVRSFERGKVESIESKIEECRSICVELRPKLEDANLQLSDRKKTLLLEKAALEQCESSFNQLKAKEEELIATKNRSDILIDSLKSIKQEVAVYADNIGMSFLYCGSFLGQEKQSLLSDHSSSAINECVLKLNQSLNEAKMILPEQTAEIKMVNEIYVQDSCADHCYHIQKLQHNFDSATSIYAAAQANYTSILELLKDLTLTKEQHKTVKDMIEKCQDLISISYASLQKSTSAFKHCLLHSDVAHLVEVVREHTGFDTISASIEIDLLDIAAINSDIDRFRRYHRCFKQLQMQIPLQEKRALLEKRKADKSLQELARLSDEKAKLTTKVQRLRELTLPLESEIRNVTSILNRTYSPDDLENAERELKDGCSHEASIELGKNHINREYEESIVKWHDAMKSANKVSVNLRLKDIEDDLKRVCSIEISRSVGKSGEPLPVYKKRAEINGLIASNDALIVTAQTGSGKSTQVPQYLADDHYTWLNMSNQDKEKSRGFRLCCTQPRRMAAKSIAERVSQEFQTPLGKRVGFRVGKRDGVAMADSKRISDDTQIEYVTEGLLLAQLRGSPKRIKNYDLIIIDEAHERNIETDLLLSFLRNHLRRLKASCTNPEPDDIPLKVIVMSASIDWQRFCEYFDGCPRLDCPGKIFDVEEHYRPAKEDDYSDDNSLSSYPNSCSDFESDIPWPSVTPEPIHFKSIAEVEKTLVQHATEILFEDILYGEKEKGDVLIFFSGSREIWECVNAINCRAHSESLDVAAYPLYSSMDEESKSASKDPSHRTGLDDEYKKKFLSADYIRKIICCTNIAETSLTIDGVRFVIDTGKAKKLRYSHVLRCMTLREEDISQAAVKQRKGRAGRTQTGWVYYLFSERTHGQMTEYELPKILQTPVEQLILYSMYNCQCSIEELGLLDSPTPSNIKTATDRLEDLGFVTYEDEARLSLRLTEDGELAGILSSLQPEAVRMLLWANVNAPLHRKRVMKMAALLSIDDDIFIGPRILREHGNKGFTKTTSRSSIQLVRKSEEYAYEQDQGVHQLGDHFLLLREFEAFENEQKRSLKTASNSKLRVWCKTRGLNYAALNQAQLLAERCHNELKKRKVLVDQRDAVPSLAETDKSSCYLTSDEAIIRAMMTGYFHQLVESNDPLLKRKNSLFTILSPNDVRFQVRLDRDSCLWKLRNNTRGAGALDFIPDDEVEEENMDTRMENRQVLISLLLFTRLQSVMPRSNQEELIFMQGATSVDVKWVCEQAPRSWLERVDLNELKSNMICGSVRSIGPRILTELLPLIDELKLETEAKDIDIDMERGEVLIYGSQAVVIRAKETVIAKAETVITEFYSKDEKSVYANQIGRFGSGLELQELCEGSGSKRYKGIVLNNPPKLLPATCQFRDPISIRISQSAIDVYVKNGWDVNLFSSKFNQVALSFNTQNEGQIQTTLVKLNKRAQFTFKFDRAGDKQQSSDNQTASQGKGDKVKRKRKRGNQVGNSQGSVDNDASGDFSFDQCFDDLKLRICEASAKEIDTLRVEDFSADKLPFLCALARESRMQTPFWKKHFTNIQFSPSHSCFEMFKVTSKELESQIATLYARKTVLSITDIAERPKQNEDHTDESDSDLMSDDSTEKIHQFTRSELCRFVATLEDLRKSHPNVLWVCNYTVGTDLDLNDEEDEKSKQHAEKDRQQAFTEIALDKEVGDQHHNEEGGMLDEDESMTESTDGQSKAETLESKTEVCNIGSLKPSFWLKSDYQRLLAVHDNRLQGQAIIDLAIALYSFSVSQPIKAFSDCRGKLKSFFVDAKQLNLLLPDIAERGTEYKVCVMCRRAIEIRYKTASSDGSKRSRHLQGRRLTICGCAYCRECFLASAEQFADCGEPIQCRNCKRQVLARADCQNIVRPSQKDEKDPFQQDLINVYRKEWTNLLHKSERKYCSDILVGGGEYSEINTCPDCSSHTVFTASKPFFRCSAFRCPNIFCCTCRRVQSSLSDEQQKTCIGRKCKRLFED